MQIIYQIYTKYKAAATRPGPEARAQGASGSPSEVVVYLARQTLTSASTNREPEQMIKSNETQLTDCC